LVGCGSSFSPNVSVQLFQFGEKHDPFVYTAQSEGKLTKCYFDTYGARFGASDTKGDLHLWKFDTALSSKNPCSTIRQCHSGMITDFAFLNSSTVLATAGISSNRL
jgi:hypothetical protein